LKSVLDNTPHLQHDEAVIASLWESISPRFLDRLLKTGSRQADSGGGSTKGDSKDMVDLAVAVIHTFSLLLPADARQDARLLDRIPGLVRAVLHRSECLLLRRPLPLADFHSSSNETNKVIVETLTSLVALSDGAARFVRLELDDWTPLAEIAPEYPHVLTIFTWAWERGLSALGDANLKKDIKTKVDKGIQSLVSSFIGTDATSLLEFVSHVLRNLDADVSHFSPFSDHAN
jgi:hypothetical protein